MLGGGVDKGKGRGRKRGVREGEGVAVGYWRG